MAVQVEGRFVWTFGQNATGSGANLNSTGTGQRFALTGLARENSFYIETDAAATCSYQIITARTLTGAQVVLSSGTLSTSGLDLVQITGPLQYVYPRIKTLNSTANLVTVEYLGN